MIRKLVSVALISIFVFCSITHCYSKENESVFIYDMGPLATDYFVNNFGPETLQTLRGDLAVYELIKDDDEVDCFYNGTKYMGEKKENVLFYLFATNEDYWYEDFFSFISVDNLQKILNQYGIADSVKERYIINLYPLSVYLVTDSSQYILVNNNTTDIINENDFKLYTPEQYKERFSIYEGVLKLQGQENYEGLALFYDSDIFIPIRSVLEIIGAKNIKWNQEMQAISFDIDGDNKKIETKWSGFMVLPVTNVNGTNSEEVLYYYTFHTVNKNGHFYMQFRDAREILSDNKIEMLPSFEKREVILKQME